ncbi:MAG: DUF4738 domain-containing protein [Bacteroides sp.]|nr:DUF4738 domain-containing protein [Bacteroides sp.]
MGKLILWAVWPVSLLVAACQGRPVETKNDITIVMQQSVDESGLHRMQVSATEQTVTYRNKEYLSSVVRVPDESLPVVTNASGDRYVDNKITLDLKLKEGGKQIFAQTFTRQNFSSVVSAEFLSNAILEGMVFDKTTPQGIVYAASLSYPHTDLYVPVAITITADGKMSMVKEDLMEEVYISGE